MKSNPNYVNNFAKQLEKIKSEITDCKICHWFTDNKDSVCSICWDENRDKDSLCVVEDYLDLLSIEKLKIYRWRYHVLWWAISPVNGVLAKDLTIKELFERVQLGNFDEIILAINPNIEWEATSMYIKENIPNKKLKISRLSKGLPNAWFIEYADEITLINAFKGRV